MRKLGEWIDDPATKHLHVIEKVATLHSRFMAIFPWAKESGRTIRIASNLLLQEGGYPIAIVHSIDRQRYYEALRGDHIGADVAVPRGRADHRRDRDPRLRRGAEGAAEAPRRSPVTGVAVSCAISSSRPRLTIPGGELALAFARSGGPGGQNVNKVSSKVELRWNAAHVGRAAPPTTARGCSSGCARGSPATAR